MNVEKLFDICKKLGWNYHDDDYGNYYISQGSPAGEDFGFDISKENPAKDIIEYAKEFNPGEYADMWIVAKYSDSMKSNGIPDIQTLINDAFDIKAMLEDLAEEVRKHEEIN